jgi:hypothetical protein
MTDTEFSPEERAQFEQAATEAEAGYSPEFLRSRPTLGRPRELGEAAGVVIQFRLDPARAARLDAYAAHVHKTRSQIIREALDQQLAAN